MAEETVIQSKLVVQSLAHDGYRRAGMAFKPGENIIPENSITCSQLAMLQADPRLAVLGTDGAVTQADPADGASGAVVQEPVSDGLIAAIGKLEPDNPDHFTTANKPQVDALEKLVGRSVTASERDDAWEDFQRMEAEKAEQAE
ncbi:HI1506-related protein [Photobacterium atrarenae]|uniref:HI1506-related protein n=1 Tax=Photobacterium atrarenae TaxID=865757 RepID=A0ABY5GM43_9GAMM|nr:HI1506-related protein [Photobacterium atrarenae]UTV30165.1 HI1506-related protein [Photobacterium atrarenae]